MKRKDPAYNLNLLEDNDPVKEKIIFGEVLPTYPEMVDFYGLEVMKRAKRDKTAITRLTGLSFKDFSLRLKKINKRKKDE